MPAAGGMEAQCRLYCILARDGRSAVVFRRGPTKQVLVLRWWLGDDRIEPGQWFRGRIYERRADLTPDGDLLLYFAAKWSHPLATWTAVSRTPYLTALALWPKGDAWGGGGVFDSDREIGLNHRDVPRAEAPSGAARKWHPLGPAPGDGPVPASYVVRQCAEWAGRGEDNPIEMHRLMRSGWKLVSEGAAGIYGSTPGYAWKLDAPEIVERASPTDGNLLLQRVLRAIGERDGSWYVEDFVVRSADGNAMRTFERCSWADWDRQGNLLIAMGGKLYRLAAADCVISNTDGLTGAGLVADLSEMHFAPRAAPDWARTWP